MERILKGNECRELKFAAMIMNTVAESLGYAPKYDVGVCYRDHGLDWKWTTVIYDKNGNGFQALYPNEWKAIVERNDFSEVSAIVRRQAGILHKA